MVINKGRDNNKQLVRKIVSILCLSDKEGNHANGIISLHRLNLWLTFDLFSGNILILNSV